MGIAARVDPAVADGRRRAAPGSRPSGAPEPFLASLSQTPWRIGVVLVAATAPSRRSGRRSRRSAARASGLERRLRLRGGGMRLMLAPAIVGRRPRRAIAAMAAADSALRPDARPLDHRRGRSPREDPRPTSRPRSPPSGGTVERNDDWRTRALAYEIRHQREGEYHLIQFTGSPSADRAALAQPADRRRGAALPDHQGPAGHAAAARGGTPGRRRSAGARRVLAAVRRVLAAAGPAIRDSSSVSIRQAHFCCTSRAWRPGCKQTVTAASVRRQQTFLTIFRRRPG